MKTCKTNNAIYTAIKTEKREGKTIAFVPTMGNLHEGHLQLVRKAKQVADIVVVSIFVNPLQFGANEDLASYPRTLATDKEKLFKEGAHYLFNPDVSEIYPEGMDNHCTVEAPAISNILCGQDRPGHFVGVATVVTKLFQIVQPDTAIFGKKDFQQLAIIRKVVKDLCMPIEIIGIETARDSNGLALSSRNGYLKQHEYERAALLQKTLNDCKTALANGYDCYHELENIALRELKEAGFEPDYFTFRDAKTLNEASADSEEIVILVAAKLGKPRLIDNITVNLDSTHDWAMLASRH